MVNRNSRQRIFFIFPWGELGVGFGFLGLGLFFGRLALAFGGCQTHPVMS
jgi:hypothetical protein